jgi:DNA-binding transcriptional regulator YhcF (GntR family)
VRERGQLLLPRIILNRSDDAPLHRQLSTELARVIRTSTTDGARLPSSRMLAGLLGVSRNTVLTAYDELAAGGLISGRRGAAMFVTPQPTVGPPDVRRLLRDAQYPARTIEISDPDGSPIYLNF